jgi:hypothetical protein
MILQSPTRTPLVVAHLDDVTRPGRALCDGHPWIDLRPGQRRLLCNACQRIAIGTPTIVPRGHADQARPLAQPAGVGS